MTEILNDLIHQHLRNDGSLMVNTINSIARHRSHETLATKAPSQTNLSGSHTHVPDQIQYHCTCGCLSDLDHILLEFHVGSNCRPSDRKPKTSEHSNPQDVGMNRHSKIGTSKAKGWDSPRDASAYGLLPTCLADPEDINPVLHPGLKECPCPK